MRIPKGYCISKDIKIKRFLYGAENYEIYSTISDNKILIITNNLYEHLCKDGLIQGDIFFLLKYDGEEYFYLKCKNDFVLSAVKNGYAICNKSEAHNFVNVFLKTRNTTAAPLFDAIYIEEYSLLLPTYSHTVSNLRLTYLCGLFSAMHPHSEPPIHKVLTNLKVGT